ncbi:MAG: hypothetical protein MUO37_04860 [Methyloceanibacter sp.]|nr:hypothetical protein [Methyloceanibacter sp.]
MGVDFRHSLHIASTSPFRVAPMAIRVGSSVTIEGWIAAKSGFRMASRRRPSMVT